MNQPKLFKNLSLPVIAAPMFLISGPKLVIECCKNGIVGTFPALNQRSSEGFERWIVEIKTALKTFEEETAMVQLQLLSATVKLFLKQPNETQDLVQKVLTNRRSSKLDKLNKIA